MDASRTLLIAIAASLARLQIRLLAKSVSARREGGMVYRDAAWTIRDLDPPVPWFDAAPGATSLSGALASVARVQAHLLAMVESPGPIDARRACVVLQHLSCGGGAWSALVLRLAEQLGVELAASPMQEYGNINLVHDEVPRPKGRRPKAGN